MKTHTTPTGIELLMHVVPRTATDIKMKEHEFGRYMELLYRTPDQNPKHGPHLITLPLDAETLIGTLVYKDGEYIFSHDFNFQSVLGLDHQPAESDTGEEPAMTIGDYEDMVISLLQSYSVGWVNPLGEKPKNRGRWIDKEGIDNDYREFVYTKKFKAWQEAESRKLSVDQMVVLIQVKKP